MLTDLFGILDKDGEPQPVAPGRFLPNQRGLRPFASH
jgi:hypothetical protein